MSAGMIFLVVMAAFWAGAVAICWALERVERSLRGGDGGGGGVRRCPCCDEPFAGGQCEACGFTRSNPAREARWS